MSLARFYEGIAPTLLGTMPPEEAARKLGLQGQDASRLSIYARFCRRHRFEVIESVFTHCCTTLTRELGQTAWEQLVEAYFRQHPMKHVELNTNGAGWPDFLAQQRALPAWAAPLADFEWWEWQTLSGPDGEPSDPDSGSLRFAPTIELRPYAYDFVGWIGEGLPASPEPRQTIVLFWRDRELALRRENVDEAELVVLKSIASGMAPPPGTEDTVEDLRAAGVLHGR